MLTPDTNDKMPPLRKPVTMRDVAELAGVSMATVSRVLNGSETVDAELAQRVRAAIARLKYQPNRAARALAGSRSAILGLLIIDIQNPFYMDVMRGVEEVAQQNGYLLVVCNSAEDPKKEQQYIEVLASEPVAGVVIVPTHERLQGLDVLAARNIPVVSIDRRIRTCAIDAVLIDNVTAAKEAVSHLIANGYKRIGVITGPKATTTSNERLLGYRLALQEAGIPLDPQLEQQGVYNEETGQQSVNALLDLDPPIDALFTDNNRITIGALRALYARHIRIPGDIALASFDEVGWAVPDLVSVTSVRQPAYELGKTATIRLLQRLLQPNSPRQEIILQHQLLIRESSTPHTAADEKEFHDHYCSL
jgi:DNA-binding LacI/PurR family transcriptional regulator